MPPSWHITPVDQAVRSRIQDRINQKTKPLGALGQLENLAMQIALIQHSDAVSSNIQIPNDYLQINRPRMLVFAADHGIAAEGVSIAPSAVTQQMVLNFLAGGAAINCFCRSAGLPLVIIDAGIAEEIQPQPNDLINQRVAAGTHNFAQQAAMSKSELETALNLGSTLAQHHINKGSNLLAFGEMGIGNSSSAAALLAALSQAPLTQCVGRGTGINDAQLTKKIILIQQALARISSTEPLDLLAEVGGFEIAQICGAMLATAAAKKIILVDGFIVTAAAMLAVALHPAARDYMIFAHQSLESGHQLMLQRLGAQPLLNLDLRLGEGTGAALALPLLNAAICFYNDMATFASAGVKV